MRKFAVRDFWHNLEHEPGISLEKYWTIRNGLGKVVVQSQKFIVTESVVKIEYVSETMEKDSIPKVELISGGGSRSKNGKILMGPGI